MSITKPVVETVVQTHLKARPVLSLHQGIHNVSYSQTKAEHDFPMDE